MKTNSYCKIQPFRFESYYKFLTRFDHMDKSPCFEYIKLNDLFVQSNPTFLSKLNIFSAALILETLAQQRLITPNPKIKISPKTNFFKVTLRKNKFFVFLDIALNSICLNEFVKFIFDHNNINPKLHFFFKTEILTNLNLISNSNEYLIFPFFYTNQIKKLKNFFWIPIKN